MAEAAMMVCQRLVMVGSCSSEQHYKDQPDEQGEKRDHEQEAGC